jgi:16S rRNA (cytosine967-C5)-methyltransferase
VAAEVVSRVLDDGAWAQPALASALSSSGMDARDKALCTELAYGTLRWAVPLEQSLLRGADKPGRGLDRRMRPHLLVAAYQLQHLAERIPARAAVSEAVEAVRAVRPGLEGFANALLRRLGSPLHEMLPANASIEEIAAALGVPPLLADAVAGSVPADEARAALFALNARPSTYAFSLDGTAPPGAQAHAFVPGAFALDGPVAESTGFTSGTHVIMDPGSAVCALLVGEADRVIDLCAAPGTKSVLLAPRAQVIAVEKNEKRAGRIHDNATRCRLRERIEVKIGDALEVKLDPAPALLLDAPCTGFGTTRRKPEIKLRRTQADVEAAAKLQQALLARAASLVSPGGTLVYSVCSPLREEGPLQIDALLARGFAVEDARSVCPWLPADAVDARGCVRLLPHRHDADAFFAVRLKR